MTNDDHLDKETTFSAELTNTGIKAAAKSRTIAAIDRFGGNILELANAGIEGVISRRRAQVDGERQLIEAATKYGVDRMAIDNEFAKRAFEKHFQRVAKAQINKDGVIAEALEDLRLDPPNLEQSTTGPEELDEHFMDRFEEYAETATSDEIRQRWGRVLASEIRRPGTFSLKALRVIDELDFQTAQLFEGLCQHSFGNVVPKALCGVLSYLDGLRLTDAGLIADPGLGQRRKFSEITLDNGQKNWMAIFGEIIIAFSSDIEIVKTPYGISSKKPPEIPVYVLTDVGLAISTILSEVSKATVDTLIASLTPSLTSGTFIKFRAAPDGNGIYAVN